MNIKPLQNAQKLDCYRVAHDERVRKGLCELLEEIMQGLS